MVTLHQTTLNKLQHDCVVFNFFIILILNFRIYKNFLAQIHIKHSDINENHLGFVSELRISVGHLSRKCHAKDSRYNKKTPVFNEIFMTNIFICILFRAHCRLNRKHSQRETSHKGVTALFVLPLFLCQTSHQISR